MHSRFSATLRARRIITKRKYLAGIASINFLFLLIICAKTISLPHTFIGSLNVGFMTRGQVEKAIKDAYTTPVSLTIQAQTYDETYARLGIYLDSKAVVSDVFQPNMQPFPTNLMAFINAFVHPRSLPSPLLFSQEFFNYIDRLNTKGNAAPEIAYVLQEQKTVSYVAPQQRFNILTKRFQHVLKEEFGKRPMQILVPLQTATSTIAESVLAANTKLSASYTQPLTIVILIYDTQWFITLSSEDLKRYTITNIEVDTGRIDFSINETLFIPDVHKALSAFGDTYPDAVPMRIRDEIIYALKKRYEGTSIESVTIHTDTGPNTDGKKANKYIEIDISQQKLFAFENGMLVYTYRVSTGKDYPTPIGEFSIQNKNGLAYSQIYNVWMPYWMGFTYSAEINASFGIHELPYYYSGENKIHRPNKFIGAPNTGGCVALDIGDAKSVYEFADIGTPVIIYQ